MRKWRFAAKLFAWALTLVMLAGVIPIQTQAATVYVERKADVVFVIDATGSMGPCIDSVKSNIIEFLNLISKEDVDVRVKFVVYKDMTRTGQETIQSDWYTATDSSTSFLANIKDDGGPGEALVDAIGMMMSNTFRSDAVKYCVFFTDEKPITDNNYGYKSQEEALAAVNAQNIVMSMVTTQSLMSYYAGYASTDKGGMMADIYGDYSILLKTLADTIIGELDKLGTLTMSPRNCKEGEEVTVRVTSNADSGITYESDFSVLFDGAAAEVTATESNYFEFKVPAGKVLGKYDVNVVNGGENTLVGHFLIESGAEYGAMSPASTIKGTATIVTVPVSKLNYQKDFRVALGGTKVTVGSKQADYFTFEVPYSWDAKSYDVVVTNGSQSEYIGDFVIQPRTPIVGAMTPTQNEQGVATTVKVDVKNLDYADDFQIYMGGIAMTAKKQLSEYFKFDVPADKEAGVYPIVFRNDNKTYTVGNYTVTPKVVIEPTIGAMSQTSSEEGTEATIQVNHTNLEYAADFAVYFDTQAMPVTKQLASYFKFKVPSDYAAGTYTVTAVNNGKTYTLGTYTVNGSVIIEPTITGMIPAENEKGTETIVQVNHTNLEYGTDFAVYFDAQAMTVTKQLAGYFKFKVPSDYAAGTYTVTMQNNKKTYTIGTYTVKDNIGNLTDNVVIGAMSQTSSEEGTEATIKVPHENLEYGTDFAVYFDKQTMTVTKQLADYFKFIVPSDCAAGTYTVTAVNNGKTYTLGTYTVTADASKSVLPVFGSLEPSSIEEGVAITVKVTYTDMTYGTDFAVISDGVTYTVSKQLAGYFKFEIPASLTAGTYAIRVKNNGAEYFVGNFSVIAKPEETPSFGGLEPSSVEEGNAATVKVTYSGMTYGNDFNVSIDGTSVNISKQLADYFKFEVPSTMSAGEHTVTLTNGGKSFNIGTFKVNAKPIIVPAFGNIEPASSTAGTKTTVKVYKTNLEYASDFAVSLDGKSMTVKKQLAEYFKFEVPADMAASTYTIKVTNNGTTYDAGTYTVN